ncbi:hypothetical protein K457DRAFT_19535 [Linnemannia elongata AG-77]|uniref:Uncharacterized protein n=1 Tax=Linnemannia elongata AG-77 TaxID=1314771 RepID=A0A197JV07_9FUNG|nr:hypothetical protein K457DRAFT_19535 [Linnemannia elongata AG-77]
MAIKRAPPISHVPGDKEILEEKMGTLQRPHRQHQSSSSISINISRSKVYSSKLVCQGNQPLEDICSTVENCPSSLKEFTLHSLYSYNYYPQHIIDSTLIVQRLGSIKDNYYFNIELEFHNLKLFFYSLLSCFPDLQELYIPFGVTLQYYHQLRSSSNERDATVISTLALDCLALTAINFGYNLIAEELKFRFVKLMPETLLEFTTAIEPGYLDRDLLGTEWVCSGLETLSIGIRDLAEYEAEQEMDKHRNHNSLFDTDAELALYLRKIHNDPYSHDIEFPDNLRWMNLKWFPIYGGLESTTTTQNEVMQRYSEKRATWLYSASFKSRAS